MIQQHNIMSQHIILLTYKYITRMSITMYKTMSVYHSSKYVNKVIGYFYRVDSDGLDLLTLVYFNALDELHH